MSVRTVWTILFFIATASYAAAAPAAETPKESLLRKARSESILRKEGVHVNATLPVIESEAEAKIRTKEEIVYRALSLLVVALKAEGLEQPQVELLQKDFNLESHFTPNERAFLKNQAPSDQGKAQYSWRYEAAWPLLWAIGFVDTLGKPASTCDVPKMVALLKQKTLQQFISEAKLRPLSELLDQADRIYRYDWAVVDARVNGKPSPAGIDSGVIVERHHALNWLISYMGQDWDDVSTDT